MKQNLTEYVGLIYENVKNEIELKTGPNRRVVYGEMVMLTQDYQPDRWTIHIDESGKIVDISNG